MPSSNTPGFYSQLDTECYQVSTAKETGGNYLADPDRNTKQNKNTFALFIFIFDLYAKTSNL